MTFSLTSARAIRRWSFAFSGSLALLAFSEAAPAEATANERALAEALFRDAKALLDAGQPTEACPKLAESQRLDPGGGTQLLLGLCYEAAGQTGSAWLELNEALSMAMRDGNSARATIAREHLAAIEPRLMRIQCTFAEGTRLPEMTIERDGIVMPEAAWTTPMPVDPGEHMVVVSAPGYEPVAVPVTVSEEGQLTTIGVPRLEEIPPEEPDVAVAPAEPEGTSEEESTAEAPQDAPSKGPSKRAVWGYSVGGIGVAATTVGAIFGGQAISLNNKVVAACPDSTCYVPELEDDHKQSKTSATLSTIFIGVGIVGLGTAAYLLLTDSAKEQPAAARAGEDEGIARRRRLEILAFDISPVAEGARFLVKGRF